ncbi:MAG: hypothetical protein K6T94_07625 [Paenibacillus sp.]|nr:hypothetical protein [Paenibacillus sp.]
MRSKRSLITVLFLTLMVIFSACDNRVGKSSDDILTLSELRILTQKGEELTWKDFNAYPFEDIGSGLYIRKYEVDGDYHLLISGRSISKAPDTIYLVKTNGEQIDIRYGDIDNF